MSYVPGFAPDAKADWRELDTQLQELVLDEMERLAANPPTTSRTMFLTDFVCEIANAKHYIWIRYVVDRKANRLIVTGISHYAQPI